MFKYFFIFFNFIFFIYTQTNYKGNLVILFLFFFSSCFFVCYSLRKNYIFTDIFLSFFLWIGFVFKFIMIVNHWGILAEAPIYIDYSKATYDKEILILCYVFFLLSFLSYIREKYFFSYEIFNQKYYYKKQVIINFFFSNQKKILFVFFIIVTLLSILNLEFSIYQKGIISNQSINTFFLAISKWLIYFGFATFSSFIIFCYLKKKKSFLVAFALALFEGFVTSFSNLTRASLIFQQFSFILGSKKMYEKVKFTINKKLILFSFGIIFCVVFLSLYAVENKRGNLLYGINKKIEFSHNKNEDMNFNTSNNNFLSNILYLSLNRWVGLDSWFAVTSNPNLSWKLFVDSFKEKINYKKYSFYERIFLKKNEDYDSYNVGKNYGILVPGFVSFSFYSGSITLLLILISLFYIVGFFIEYLSFKFSYGNFIFSSLISQVYVYRLIHFGYMPSNTWMLILAIAFNIFLYNILCNFVYFLKK